MNIPFKNSSVPVSPAVARAIADHFHTNLSPSYRESHNFDDTYQSSVIINDINVEEELSKIEDSRKNFFQMLSMSFYARPKSHSVDHHDSRDSNKTSAKSQDNENSATRAKSCHDKKKKGRLYQQENFYVLPKKNPFINDLEVRLDQFCPKIALPKSIKEAPITYKPDPKKVKKGVKPRYSEKDKPPGHHDITNKFRTSRTEFESVPTEGNEPYMDLEGKKLSNSELCMYAEGLIELLHKSQKFDGDTHKSRNKAFDAMLHEMWGPRNEDISSKEVNIKEAAKAKRKDRSFLYDKSSTTVTNENGRSFQLSSDSQSRVYLKQGSQDKGASYGTRKASYGKKKEPVLKKSREQESRSGERDKSGNTSKSKEKKKFLSSTGNNSTIQNVDNDRKKYKRDPRLETTMNVRIRTEERSSSIKSETKRFVPPPVVLSKKTPMFVDKDLESWDTMPISISQGEITRKAQFNKRSEKKSPDSKGRKESPKKITKQKQVEKLNASMKFTKGKLIEQ